MKLLISPGTAFIVLVANCIASLSFADSKQLKSVGMTVGDLANPFFVKVARTAEEKAKEYNPNVKFTSLSGSYDVNNQTNQIDNFVSSGVDLILLAPVDSKGIAPAVARAKAAGVVVIVVGDRADGGVDATVLSDHVQAGQLEGKYIAQRLNGKGQIVIVNGPPVSAVFERVKGALDVLSGYPEIKILSQDQNANGSRDGGLRVMTDLLTAFPKIDAVFAINDPTGIGCDLAAVPFGIQSSIRHYVYPVRHWESTSADFSFKSATMESQIIQELRPRLDARHEQVVPGPRAREET
jgi:ribose transport system substrate-binding protein